MVTTNFIPILPKKGARDTGQLRSQLRRDVTNNTIEGMRFIAKYPAQRLRKTGYRRTGTLKRSWSRKVRLTGDAIIGTVGSNSNIAPYNRIVQGPRTGPRGKRQARIMRRAGWRNQNDLTKLMDKDIHERLDMTMRRFTA